MTAQGATLMAGVASLRLLAAAALVACLLAPVDARCQIYTGVDRGSGPVVLSNFRTAETAIVVDGTVPPPRPASAPAPAPKAAPGKAASDARPSADLRAFIDDVAGRNKLQPALLHAVITAESRYDPHAVSAKGAIGLMQLLPATGERFGATDLFSAEQNVSAGAGYLGWLMALFDGDLELALAAYNAGEHAVIDAGCRVPPYPETRAYVRKILDSLPQAHAATRRPGAAGGPCVRLAVRSISSAVR